MKPEAFRLKIGQVIADEHGIDPTGAPKRSAGFRVDGVKAWDFEFEDFESRVRA